MTARQRGFTLVELLIALAIVGALLAVAFGGLRVAIAAWNQGENRAEAHAHLRGLAVTLARTVGAAYPYRAPLDETSEPTVLFRGTATRLELVTQAAPFPFAVPIAFTAVVVGTERDDNGQALVVRERALPNRAPFGEARVVLRDDGVQAVGFQYLEDGGGWLDEWDGEAQKSLPRAVRITLRTAEGGPDVLPPLTIALRTVVVGP